MKSTIFIITLFLILGATTNEKRIIGIWQAKEENNRKIEIYQDKDGLYQGKSISHTNGQKSSNVIKNLKYDATSKSYMGTMSPPDKDITLNVTITITDNDELKVVTRKLLITKTMFFIRSK